MNYFVKNVGFRLEDYVFFPRVGGGWTERGAGIGIQVLGRIFWNHTKKRHVNLFWLTLCKENLCVHYSFYDYVFFYKKSRPILQNF